MLKIKTSFLYIMTKTYFVDIDGTIVSNLTEDDLEAVYSDKNYVQELLPGVGHFFLSLNETDVIIFTTARIEKYREMTERTKSILQNSNIYQCNSRCWIW